MTTYSTSSLATSTRSSAPRIALAPRSVAASAERPPPSRPNGVRTAETMTERAMAARVTPSVQLTACAAVGHHAGVSSFTHDPRRLRRRRAGTARTRARCRPGRGAARPTRRPGRRVASASERRLRRGAARSRPRAARGRGRVRARPRGAQSRGRPRPARRSSTRSGLRLGARGASRADRRDRGGASGRSHRRRGAPRRVLRPAVRGQRQRRDLARVAPGRPDRSVGAACGADIQAVRGLLPHRRLH